MPGAPSSFLSLSFLFNIQENKKLQRSLNKLGLLLWHLDGCPASACEFTVAFMMRKMQ